MTYPSQPFSNGTQRTWLTESHKAHVKPQKWLTDLQKWCACHRVCVLGKYALSIVIFIIRSSQWREHQRGQATRHSMVTSISRWPKLASCATHRRRKGRGLAGAEEKRASCLARRFSFSAIAFKNLFLQFFPKLLSLSVGEGFECVCWIQKEKFPTACRTVLHVFPSFLQSRRQSENFTLAESWRNGPFCL